MSVREKICEALCQSGKFETGQGTCALICMDQLGEARKPSCHHQQQVHGDLADKIIDKIISELAYGG